MTKLELEKRLSVQGRELSAAHEWFLCTARPDVCGNVTASVSVTVHAGDEPIVVEAVGLARASGGVVVVRCGTFADFPEHLDDLVMRWRQDWNEQIREAARTLEAARWDALSA